jgi:hypothetical protein
MWLSGCSCSEWGRQLLQMEQDYGECSPALFSGNRAACEISNMTHEAQTAKEKEIQLHMFLARRDRKHYQGIILETEYTSNIILEL